MIRALAYLWFLSWANRLTCQVQRLKKPKYLAGALAGGAYLYFFFVRPMFVSRRGGGPLFDGTGPLAGEYLPLVEFAGALSLIVFVVLAWLLPKRRAALDFSEAEIAFLFPAPLTRRGLIHFKLVKSQAGLLISALLMTFLVGRWLGSGRGWMQALGWWLVLATLELHQLGASFARTLLLDRGVSHRQRRWVVLGVVLVLLLATVWWARATLPPLDLEQLVSGRALADHAQQVMHTGPAWLLLLAPRALVAPMLAPDGLTFAWALLPALLLLGAHYAWVVRSDVSFEEASLEKARERARMAAAVRSGTWHLAREGRAATRPPFLLRPNGFRAVALFWKNLIAAESMFTLWFWVLAGVGLVVLASLLKLTAPASIFLRVAGGAVVTLTPVLFLVGPHMLPLDLRQDLPLADSLKTYPLPGWQVVLGEILAPATILTGVQWCFLGLAVVLFPEFHQGPGLAFPGRVVVGLSVAVAALPLNLASFLLFNGAVLLFPLWTRTGAGAAQGFEAIGQRLLFMAGQLLALALVLVPGAAAFGVVYFLAHGWVKWLAWLPLATLASTLTLALEVFIGLRMLGDLFERLDLAEEMLQ